MWTVGESLSTQLFEHYNGRHWSVVVGPKVDATVISLNGVAVNRREAWAVGWYSRSSTLDGQKYTFTEHWNGKVWRVVKSPNSGDPSDQLNAVASTASGVVSVGQGGPMQDPAAHSLILLKRSKPWSMLNVPTINRATRQLLAGTAAGAGGVVWAVGSYSVGRIGGFNGTLVEEGFGC